MKLIESITASSWVTGFKHITCSRPECTRWLTQRHFETRKVGVKFEEKWFCSYRCLARGLERTLGKMLGPVGVQTKHSFRMPLGLTLVSRGYLTSDQLREANELHRERGQEIGETLLDLGFVNEKQLTAVKAAQWGCPAYDLPACMPPAAFRVPATMMKRYLMVPLQYVEKQQKLSIGFCEGIEYVALYAVEQITGCKAQPYLITASDYQRFTASLSEREVFEEQVFDDPHTPAEMRHVLCSFGAQMDAEEIAVTRCGDQLWTRLTRGKEVADLLFRVG